MEVCDEGRSVFIKEECSSEPEDDIEPQIPEVILEEKEPLEEKLNENGDGGPIQCYYCNIWYENAKSLNEHIILKHTRERKHECKICGNCFFTVRHLNRHIKRHGLIEREYKCNLCQKGFVSSWDLNRHLKTHLKEPEPKDFKCDVCEKKFTRASNLNKHKRLHTGLQKYVCNVCNKRYNSNLDLFKHSTVHTGIYPFYCAICQKGYVNKSNLQKHEASCQVRDPLINEKLLEPQCELSEVKTSEVTIKQEPSSEDESSSEGEDVPKGLVSSIKVENGVPMIRVEPGSSLKGFPEIKIVKVKGGPAMEMNSPIRRVEPSLKNSFSMIRVPGTSLNRPRFPEMNVPVIKEGGSSMRAGMNSPVRRVEGGPSMKEMNSPVRRVEPGSSFKGPCFPVEMNVPTIRVEQGPSLRVPDFPMREINFPVLKVEGGPSMEINSPVRRVKPGPSLKGPQFPVEMNVPVIKVGGSSMETNSPVRRVKEGPSMKEMNSPVRRVKPGPSLKRPCFPTVEMNVPKYIKETIDKNPVTNSPVIKVPGLSINRVKIEVKQELT